MLSKEEILKEKIERSIRYGEWTRTQRKLNAHSIDSLKNGSIVIKATYSISGNEYNIKVGNTDITFLFDESEITDYRYQIINKEQIIAESKRKAKKIDKALDVLNNE